MTKERYLDNIGYLHSQVLNTIATTPQWKSEGIPFKFNKLKKKRDIFNPQAGTYKAVASEVWVTDTQIEFKQGDRVSNKPIPLNNVNYADFWLIESIDENEIDPKGNRYRDKPVISSALTLQ